MKKVFCLGLIVIPGLAFSQDSVKTKDLSEVVLLGKKNIYKADTSVVVAKLPLKDIENPQVYNTITRYALKDQVVTNLNGALKNGTGVTRLWESTGRGGDGAEYYSLRGFAVQPTLVNGMVSISNGSIDPANIESVEVIKGPSGTLYGGSLVSYGGLINITTKQPNETRGGEIGYVGGSYGLNRLTADLNTPLSKNVFLRVNGAYHNEKSFQDAGFNRSVYIAPSLKVIASNKLSFLLNAEFRQSESVGQSMVFLSRYTPLSFNSINLFERNYRNSFTSNDLSIKNPFFSSQAQAIYKLGEKWTSQTILSRSQTRTDGYYQYLWDSGNGDEFTRYINKAHGETNATGIQQNFTGEFMLGDIRNRMVVGLDYLHNQITSNNSAWVANGTVSFVNQTDDGNLTKQGVDQLLLSGSTPSETETRIASAYVSNVTNFTPALSLMLSARVDNFTGMPLYAADEIKSQTTFSPKLGIVYQPVLDKLSIFANYMNGFSNLAPAQVAEADGSNPRLKIFDPEYANQWEAGAKANLYKNKIALTASYYHIMVSNKVMTDPDNQNNSIQGGEVESKGMELSLITNPIEGLSIISGFSKNKSEVTRDAEDGGYIGMRPEEAGPETIVNFWVNYKVPVGKFRNLGAGFGVNHASEHKTLNRKGIGTFAIPSYTVMNGVISYSGNNYDINLKVDNIANVKYFSGWSTVTPQKMRSVSLGLNYRF